jgi:hypothetical protein
MYAQIGEVSGSLSKYKTYFLTIFFVVDTHESEHQNIYCKHYLNNFNPTLDRKALFNIYKDHQ